MNGKVDLHGDAWGWNLGLLYQATTDTRIGLSYRSKMRFNASGTTTLGNLPLGLPARTADASTTVTLPDTAILSVVHDLNSQWQLLGDVSWTGWSSIPSLDIKNNGSLPDESLKLKFRDTWRIALGANYKYSPKWTFKAGVAYDQSPVHDAQYRPTSLPDNDRIWLSVGAQYHFNDHTTVDVGYAHLFLKNPSINNATDPTKGTVYGSYKANVDMLGVQVSYRF
jgi:long-chain fatty acid transport protein